MSDRNHLMPDNRQAGYSLVEMVVVITLIGIVSTIFYVFFNSSIKNYLALQKEASSLTQLSTQSTRLISVLRGVTGIISAEYDDMELYAYFYPSDTYVSKLHYYVATENGVKQLRADLTPMNGNPPLGSPLTDKARTFVIIENLYLPSGSKMFVYKGVNDVELPVPINDLQSIKTIQVNLASTPANPGGSPQTMSVQASLRNRKTNL